MIDQEVEAAVEIWVRVKDDLETAKALAEQASRRVNELALAQATAAEILGKRVGANISRRVHRTKDGRCVLVYWHSRTFTEVSMLEFE